MKIFLGFTVPILLSALACSDIALDPYWSEYELPGGPALGLRDIAASANGEVWGVGMAGEGWYYDGESWYERHTGFEYELTGVATSEDGGCWAVGADSGETGHILRFDPDEGWIEVALPGTPAFLADIDRELDGTVFTVGSEGEVWRWEPTRGDWELIYTDPNLLWRAVNAGADRSLVVGGDLNGNGVYAWITNGELDEPQTCDYGRFEDAELLDSGDAWLLAVDGVALCLSDGELALVADIGYSLLGLEALNADFCLAGGVGGLLYRVAFNGYDPVESGTTENIHDLVLLTENEGWAAAQTLLLEYR